MKKIILLIMLLFVAPYFVNAMAYSEEFYIGESVSVAIEKDNERVGFHVLRYSGPNEQTVTLIYDGTVGSQTVYDETIPADNHEATVILNNSLVYKKMLDATKNWRVETGSVSLLSQSDLSVLNISKDINGKYLIPEKYAFLNPRKLDGLSPEMYNYWTSFSNGVDSVYCVTYNNDALASLEAKNITSITDNPKCAIRPVVVVDKKYIICNNDRPTENIDTGVEDYILPLLSVIALASLSIYFVNKKQVFKEI